MTTIYALGSNGSGQLGIGHTEDVSVPKEVLFQDLSLDKGIQVQVKAGGNHTLILLSSGRLLCAGNVLSGACGIIGKQEPSSSKFWSTCLASVNGSSPPDIIFCASTWDASFIVHRDDLGRGTKVYSFGTGKKGELGQGQLSSRSHEALQIPDFPPCGREVVDLAASVAHVVAVLDNGDVYGWGNGRKGQLGEPHDIIQSPRKIENLEFKVLRAVCGREFTYLLAKPRIGHHAVLGSDKWGVRASAPETMTNWKDVGASWCSIFVLRDDGVLVSWGRDDHGQLAPTQLPRLSQIAIGSEHALAIAEDNAEVLAWGWGEHGNCGPSTEAGDVKGAWNMIASSKYLPEGRKISSIGAGCATSWICTTST